MRDLADLKRDLPKIMSHHSFNHLIFQANKYIFGGAEEFLKKQEEVIKATCQSMLIMTESAYVEQFGGGLNRNFSTFLNLNIDAKTLKDAQDEAATRARQLELEVQQLRAQNQALMQAQNQPGLLAQAMGPVAGALGIGGAPAGTQ